MEFTLLPAVEQPEALESALKSYARELGAILADLVHDGVLSPRDEPDQLEPEPDREEKKP
jgi:hypothetical protein